MYIVTAISLTSTELPVSSLSSMTISSTVNSCLADSVSLSPMELLSSLASQKVWLASMERTSMMLETVSVRSPLRSSTLSSETTHQTIDIKDYEAPSHKFRDKMRGLLLSFVTSTPCYQGGKMAANLWVTKWKHSTKRRELMLQRRPLNAQVALCNSEYDS